MGRRHRARELALQILYQLDLGGEGIDEVLESFWRTRPAPDEVRAFAERLVRRVWPERTAIDAVLQGCSQHWRLERMAAVDRNLLRLAAGELMLEPETPPAVIIDEAVEIAKRFGNAESAAFVNGVLDAVRRRRDEPSPDGHPTGDPPRRASATR